MRNQTLERISWWAHHPRFELIYLLGGIPRQHINVMHYRNIVSIVEDFKKKIEAANV